MKDDEPPGSLRWLPNEPKFCTLLQYLAAESRQVYVVGGAVRDAMALHLNRQGARNQASTAAPPLDSIPNKTTSDLDIALPNHACRIARCVADKLGWAFYKLDAERDIARLVDTNSTPPLACDVARLQGETLSEDLAKRDFSINAMAFEVTQGSDWVTLIDNHNGLQDLEQKQIRRVDADSMEQDSVRLLRAVRFAAQFGFSIEAQTRNQILERASTIVESSQERIHDELWKALAARRPDAVVEELRSLGLLEWILPEVANLVGVPQSSPHFLDVYQHTLLAVRHAGFLRDWILRDNSDVNLSTSDHDRTSDSDNASAPNENINSLEGGLQWFDHADHGFSERGSSKDESMALLVSALEKWLPLLKAHFGHELAAGHTRCDWLVWLALFHDVGKPDVRTEELSDDGALKHRFFDHENIGANLTTNRLDVLHFSRDEVKLASKAVAGHMRPHHLNVSFPQKSISRRAKFRFFRKLGQIQGGSLVGIDVVLLALADRLAIHRLLNPPFGEPPPSQLEIDAAIEQWKLYISHMNQLLDYAFDDAGIPAMSRPRLVDGNLLMERLGIKPGPEMGHLIEQIAEAQAAGEVETVDEALKWAADQIL